ncbi:c-type cytochrome [Pontibacter sp. Tf4]|uniref:c-type cytochrome domain-containing protein n=1 Tax=Pontibacter sp. Tf4 TaxID=2761620 RepID=UPI0016298AA4|nr:c-type cytochrome domain-containing protein [Pontibacter sp. Tf4]MBB6610801.1 c-type cytochrome [Pontibacter sp. Tf4]
MKKQHTWRLLLSILLTMSIAGCKHDVPEPIVTDEPTDPTDPTGPGSGKCDPNVVYFQRDVLPVLVSNCAISGCHDATTRQDGVQLTDYASVMRTAEIEPGDPEDSELYERITEDDPEDRMPLAPRAPLSSAQIALIRKWIEQGAKDLTCTDNTACNTTNVTFSGTIKPIFSKYCTGCHSGAAPTGGINLTIYDHAAGVAKSGRLVGAVTHAAGFEPMPQGGAKLPACEINQIKAWVDAGAPNN